jgi:hypothetical protein
LGVGERPVGEEVVARDGQDLGTVELGGAVADLTELTGADATEREREEHQHHGSAAERRQGDVLAVLALQREVWSRVPDLQGHGSALVRRELGGRPLRRRR